jgi:hypothetical protein
MSSLIDLLMSVAAKNSEHSAGYVALAEKFSGYTPSALPRIVESPENSPQHSGSTSPTARLGT